MSSKNEILEILKSKEKGKSIHVKTFEYSYWGRLLNYENEIVTLKPYYTNREEHLPLHDHKKELLIDEITDVD